MQKGCGSCGHTHKMGSGNDHNPQKRLWLAVVRLWSGDKVAKKWGLRMRNKPEIIYRVV